MPLKHSLLFIGQLAAVSLLAACPGSDSFDGPGVRPTGPNPPNARQLSTGDNYACGFNTENCRTALGGTTTLYIGPNSAEDMELSISGGFELFEVPTIPPLSLQFTVRAPNREIDAEARLTSSNWDPVVQEFASRDVFDVSIVPRQYVDAVIGQQYRVPASDPRFVVALWSNEYSGFQPPYDLGRLVDTSLRTDTPNVEQLEWDVFALPRVPGTYPIVFTSDSTGDILFEVEVE